MRESSRPGLRFTRLTDLRAHLTRLAGTAVDTSGEWQAGQIYYHLAASFEATCSPSGSTGSRWARLKKLPLRLYVLRAGFPRGVAIPTAVREQLNPPPGVDEEQQLARLQRAIDAFEAATGSVPPHPVFGPLTRDEWRRLHLRHCELHLEHVAIREG